MTIYHRTGSFHLPSTRPSYAPSLPLEPTHGTLHIHPDVDMHHLQASIEWTLLSHVDSAQEVSFDGVDLDIVRVQADDAAIHSEYDGSKLKIRWSDPIAKGQSVKVKIDYQVASPIAGCYFGGPTPEMPNRGLWMATDHETARARYWIPCIDHSNVRTTWDIFITHRSDHTAVSAGHLVSTTAIDDQTSKSHWKQEQLCPVYLLCLIVGEYERVDFEPLRDIPIAGFAPKGNNPEDIRRAFAPTKALIEFAETLLGPLPWPKYFQFAAPGIGGAMENISLVSWDSRLLFDANMHQDLGFLFDQINLHELAHTWFGDLIVCRDYAHVWLKESWATYFESVWMEHTCDTDRQHEELIAQRESYFGEVKGRYSRPIMTRVFDSAWKMYDMHLYPGGAARLHMLRNKIGSDNFWKATRDYIETYAQKVVETDDFRRKLELHSGQSLAHFFDQWFCRAGYPKIKISQEHFSDTNILRLKITQSIIGGQKEDPAFQFDLQIAIQDQHDQWSEHTIKIDEFHHTFRFPCTSKPKQIIIDPNCIAVTEVDFDPSLEMNKTILNDSPYWHGRLIAGRNLAKMGTTLSLQALEEAFDTQHVGVRAAIAKGLGKCKHPKARQLLSKWLETESIAQAQASIVQALASHRSANAALALETCANDTEKSHRIRGLALTSLSKLGRFSKESLIQDYSKDNGWRHSIRGHAINALGNLHSESAFDTLNRVVLDQSEAYRTRGNACTALASCAKKISPLMEGRANQTLIDALQDPHPHVRLCAVNGLKMLGKGSSIGDLEAVRSQIPVQNAPDITRAVKACQKGSGSAPNSALSKRIEKLEEENQTLKQELQDIKAQLDVNKDGE